MAQLKTFRTSDPQDKNMHVRPSQAFLPFTAYTLLYICWFCFVVKEKLGLNIMLGTWIKFSGVAKHDGIWVGSPNLGYNFSLFGMSFFFFSFIIVLFTFFSLC